MNTKICPECGTTFQAKRADAICCSNKCRSAFNYKRKERKKNGIYSSSAQNPTDNNHKEIEISGDIEIKQLVGRIDGFEKHILRIQDEIGTIEEEEESLNKQMTDVRHQIAMKEMGDKLKLQKRAEMSDYALYNNFLNVAYQVAKKKGDQFAKNRLLSEEHLQSKFNHELKFEIQNYRSALCAKLEKLSWGLKVMQDQLDDLLVMLEKNNLKLSELHNELRFYEARILKYESLLTG